MAVHGLQDALRAYAKAVADAIWEVQQGQPGQPQRLAAAAAALDARIDALPDLPLDATCVLGARASRRRGTRARVRAQTVCSQGAF